MNILFLDKYDHFSRMLSTYFFSLGFNINFANEVSEYFEKKKDQKLDIVIINSDIGELNTLNSIKTLHKLSKDVKIIVYSISSSSNFEPQLRELSVYYYGIKPYEILNIVDAVIALKKK